MQILIYNYSTAISSAPITIAMGAATAEAKLILSPELSSDGAEVGESVGLSAIK